MARHGVVPRRVERGWCHVVVVHDEPLTTGPDEGGDGRRGRKLVDEDVPRLGLLGVAIERTGQRSRLLVGQLDVELRAHAARAEHLVQAQRVAPDGVAAVQHRHELMDRRHGAVAPAPTSGASRLTKRSAAAARSSSPRRRLAASAKVARRGASASNAWMAPASAYGSLSETRTPAPPSTSGTAPWSKATTGRRAAMASTTGTPNPSCSDVTTSTSASAYADATVASLACPLKRTASANPISTT